MTLGGYGDSEGRASELSAYADAQAAVDYLVGVQQLPVHRLLAHGLSIGGAAAAAAALLPCA